MDNLEIWVSEYGYTSISSFYLYDTLDPTYDQWEFDNSMVYVDGLKPDTRYWIMIRTSDSEDPDIKGSFSEPMEFRTEVDDYPLFYDGVFEIWVSEYGDSYGSFTHIGTETINTSLSSYTFESLKPDNRYWVMIREIYPPDGSIKGSFSEVLEFRTDLAPDTGRRLVLSTDGSNFYVYSGAIVASGGLVVLELEPDSQYYAKIVDIETSEESNMVTFRTLEEPHDLDTASEEECDMVANGVFFRSSSVTENNTINTEPAGQP